MYKEIIEIFSPQKLNKWQQFISKSGLKAETLPEKTILLMEGEKILASGSREDKILKYIAVDPDFQGQNLTATLMTELKKDAFSQGINHLFLYTKPGNEDIFAPFFFCKVASTDNVLLMESPKNGIGNYLASLPQPPENSVVGAVVVNCNPFTSGHRYLIENASANCDFLYIFVVSEDKSMFSAQDRLTMVELGTKDIANAVVVPSGDYLISSTTFPSYFSKESKLDLQCGLDIEIFGGIIAKELNISKRFAGSEPNCILTRKYNEYMKTHLPRYGVEFTEFNRIEKDSVPISASLVRKYIEANCLDKIKELVPPTTFDFIVKGR